MKIHLLFLLLLMMPAARANLLQDFLHPVQAFKAQFVQRTQDEQGQVLAEDRGWMVLARPDRFHWQVESPFPQLIVSDGKVLWQVDPELQQATRQTLQGEQAGGWLWAWTHPDQLQQRFDVEEVLESAGTGLLKLQARAEQGVQELVLQFEAGQPVRIVSTDALGGRVVIELTHLQLNPALRAEDFQFTPPPGMDVLQADETVLPAAP